MTSTGLTNSAGISGLPRELSNRGLNGLFCLKECIRHRKMHLSVKSFIRGDTMKRMKRSILYCHEFSVGDLCVLDYDRNLSEIKDVWKQMAALDHLLQDKRAYLNIARTARTRQKRYYFEALAYNCSSLIRRNQGWYRKFDRYLAAGRIMHAWTVLKVMTGYSREMLELTPICWHIV